jgi:hypothetical protein
MVLSGLGIIVVPFVRDVPLVVVSILAGIGIGTVWTNTDTLISGLAREGRLGATMGVGSTRVLRSARYIGTTSVESWVRYR